MIISLRSIFMALCFMSSISSSAQEYSISGKVIDTYNKAVSFTNIVLLQSADSSFVKGTSTDDTGRFEISAIKGNYILKASFIGYKDIYKVVNLSQDVSLEDIILVEDAENLEQVDIIARKPTITRKPDRLTFNVENTALIEGSTLQVLKNTPGIIVSQGGINIKSAPATVFINNRRVQLTSSELIQLLESAPANSIKSVEVITNPPASYDADSGAVINIIMSKNLVTGYRGSLFSNYTQGVFPRYNAGTSHYFKNNKINLNVNYSYTNQKINRDNEATIDYLDSSNRVEEIWQSDVNRNTWSETHNLNLNFDYYFDDRNTLSISSTGLYTPYFKYQIKNNTDIRDENLNFLSRFTADNLSRDNKYNIGSDIAFRHDFEDNSSFTLSGHYTIYDYERDQNVISNFFDDSNVFRGTSEFNTLANQGTEILTAKMDYNLPIDDTTNFSAGGKYSNTRTDSDITRVDIINGTPVVNPENTDAFKYDEKIYAGYVNFSKTWDKWDLSLGLRVEQTNIEGISVVLDQTNFQDYLNWFPNAGLSYQVSDDAMIYANYKRSITRPSYTDLNPFTFFLNENTVVAGNPNLIPTYQDHFIIGTTFLDYFTVEAYYINYDGDIVNLPRQDNNTNILAFTPVNLDKKVDFGFDFLFNYYITDRWYVYAVTSFYNMTEETNFGEGFVSLDQWANLSILSNSFRLLEDNSLNISLNLTYGSKNLQKLALMDARLISSLSISKSLFNKKGTVSLIIEDLFNEQDFFETTSYLNQSSQLFTNLDNRFIKLGFSYKFGNTKLSTNERTTDVEERNRLKDLQKP